MNQPVLSFRSGFWVGWRWVTSFVGTLTLATIGVTYLSGWETRLPSPLVPVVFVLAAGLGIAIAVWYYPVYVAAEGLKCYDGILTFAIESPGGTRGVMGIILRRCKPSSRFLSHLAFCREIEERDCLGHPLVHSKCCAGAGSSAAVHGQPSEVSSSGRVTSDQAPVAGVVAKSANIDGLAVFVFPAQRLFVQLPGEFCRWSLSEVTTSS